MTRAQFIRAVKECAIYAALIGVFVLMIAGG
jgi:hypothetical protein